MILLARRRPFVMLAVMLAVLSTVVAPRAVLATGVYPPEFGVSVTTDKQAYLPDEEVVLTATACAAGAEVTFVIIPVEGGETVIVTAVAVSVGSSAVATTTIAAGIVGDYVVTASCGVVSAETVFRVFKLPVTGSSINGTLVFASLAVALGLGFYVVARSRRRSPP